MGSGNSDAQITTKPAGLAPDAHDASAKLTAESNHIGMTGFVGGAERLALTTVDGLVMTFPGIYHAAKYDLQHPMELAKTITSSIVVGAVVKAALPEAGPVGKVASYAMGALFLAESAPGFYRAWGDGMHAKTWLELHEAAQKWGDSGGDAALNFGIGYFGGKLGSAGAGKILARESFDNFADSKQAFWDRRVDQLNRWRGKTDAIPTASSVGLRANYVIDGDKAVLLDTVRPPVDRTVLGPTAPEAEMNGTVVVKNRATTLRMDRYLFRKANGAAPTLTDENDAFAKQFGASPESMKAVTDFAAKNNLTVHEADLRSGKVYLTGKAADFQKAFSVEVNQYEANGAEHTGHDGAVSLPKAIASDVQAVFLDDAPTAKSSNRVLYKVNDDGSMTDPKGNLIKAEDAPIGLAPAEVADFIKRGGYLATQVARAQNIPMGTGGKGQHGGFFSLDGGIDLEDHAKFFPDHGLQQAKPLRITEVDGAKNDPGKPNSGDTENSLDAYQMQSVAPEADIDMILGKNSDQGLYGVVERGVFPKGAEPQKTVLSSSWGLAEAKQTPQILNTLGIQFRLAAIRGVQVFAGAGDNGAKSNSDFFQPEFPASDPNVVGVGGLKMILNQDGKLVAATTWDEGEHSSTGGGISKIIKVPWWQRKLKLPMNLDTGEPGRASPDIATQAAKSVGFPVRVAGQNYVIGGTSAGAPLYAGMMLNINAELAALNISPITPLNPWMYARSDDSKIFHDITTGGNHGYNAAEGYDPTTGLGWVDGTQMLEAMKVNQTARLAPNGSDLTKFLKKQASVLPERVGLTSR